MPHTSGFHVTTTHKSAQVTKIQAPSHQPPTSWPTCYCLLKTGNLQSSSNSTANNNNLPILTLDWLTNPNCSQRKGQASPTRQFFEETGGRHQYFIAPGPAPIIPVKVNQETGVHPQTVLANPEPANKVTATVAGSSPDNGSLITLNYFLYVSTYNHLSTRISKAKNKSVSKKIVLPKNVMPLMQINLHNRTWGKLGAKIIRVIGNSRRHLNVYIARLMNECQIKFHFYIPNSHTFTFKRNYYVMSDAEYQAFPEELVQKPNSATPANLSTSLPGHPAATPSNSVSLPGALAHVPPATPLNANIHPALVANDHLWIMNSLPSTIKGLAALSESDFLAQESLQLVVRHPSPVYKSLIEYLDDASFNPITYGIGEPSPSHQVAHSPHCSTSFKGKGKSRAFH
ncbi:hypothetical protein PSTT_09252, partial [Puccinia striiformis]